MNDQHQGILSLGGLHNVSDNCELLNSFKKAYSDVARVPLCSVSIFSEADQPL